MNDDEWFIVEPENNIDPIRQVEPVAIEGKWLRLNRHTRVKNGMLAFRGREEAVRQAKKLAAERVSRAQSNLQLALSAEQQVHAFK